MSIKKIAIIALIATSALSAVADDSDKLYFGKLNVGYAAGSSSGGNSKKPGNSYLAGVEAGGKLGDYVRISLSFEGLPKFSAQMNWPTGTSAGKTKISTYRGFFNLYVDAGNFNGFKPYLVFGAGFAKNKTKDTSLTLSSGTTTTVAGSSKTSGAYKAGLGTAYAVNEDFDVSLHYQYVDNGKFQTQSYSGTTYNGKLKTNEAVLGLAYKF